MASDSDSCGRRRWLTALCGLGGAGLAGCLDAISGESTGDDVRADDANGRHTEADRVHPEYETRVVRIETPDGDVLGSVTAAIADTDDLRYTGLSDTEVLPDDRGMLFVYESVADRTFVMREMDFGIDIVYADGEGVITEIHHAPAPGPEEDGNLQRYPGWGQYVLEVNYRWTEAHGVEVGDVLRFDPVVE
ncbi:MAG: DUF192 domain-containing protein [Natronomonas sp.]